MRAASFISVVFQITPSQSLDPSGVTYNILIPSGAVKPTNTSNNDFAGYTSGQYTFHVADTQPPYMTSLYPPHGSSSFAHNGNLVVTFNEAIQRGGSGNIVLAPTYGAALTQPEAITIAASSDQVTYNGTRLQINPDKDLSIIGVNYTVSIDPQAVLDQTKSHLPVVTYTVTAWNGSNGTYYIDGAQPGPAGLTLYNRNEYIFNLDHASLGITEPSWKHYRGPKP